MNSVNLIGRLTRDIEKRYTTNNKAYTGFDLAVDRGDKTADFFRCIAWEKTADLLEQYTTKGSQIGITGRLRNRSWETSEGKKMTVTEIIVDRFYFCSNPKREESPATQAKQQVANNKDSFYDLSDGDLPF